jgi:ribosomal protein L6P/L9E
MSRIGKLPIKIPANVDVTFNGNDITVKGKFGKAATIFSM